MNEKRPEKPEPPRYSPGYEPGIVYAWVAILPFLLVLLGIALGYVIWGL